MHFSPSVFAQQHPWGFLPMCMLHCVTCFYIQTASRPLAQFVSYLWVPGLKWLTHYNCLKPITYVTTTCCSVTFLIITTGLGQNKVIFCREQTLCLPSPRPEKASSWMSSTLKHPSHHKISAGWHMEDDGKNKTNTTTPWADIQSLFDISMCQEPATNNEDIKVMFYVLSL